jgi:hypothetical protein
MNEKAGMNETELEKFILKAIVPLYPDAGDEPGKRVLLKVDSGPGRTNVEMLTKLRLRGFYLSPGVPNTTHVTQETDQSYGPFKSGFRSNLRMLSDNRLGKGETLKISDLPLLVFGGPVDDELTLIPVFDRTFCKKNNKSAWEAVGACPLTRNCLNSEKVRHELVRDENGVYVVDADPMSQLYIQLETHNGLCCDLLSSLGFDGDAFRVNAPSRLVSSEPAVTVAHSRERQLAILSAKTAGDHFFATGGDAINSDDYFMAKAIGEQTKQVEEMIKAKSSRMILYNLQTNARAAMENHNLENNGIARLTIAQIKPLLLWKLQGKAVKGTKAQQIEQWRELPEPAEVGQWTEEEERRLQDLKTKTLTLKDTGLADERKRMVTAVVSQIEHCSPATIQTLEEKIWQKLLNEINSAAHNRN